MQPLLEQLVLDLKKDKKQLDKKRDLALKKELGISDAELKQLKKNLKEAKGRDGRGIQTVFRTTSRNHYTLNQMVDSKASIMITVNSILLSLVLGGVIGQADEHGLMEISHHNLPLIILTITCIASIFYAVLAIRPNQTQGEFTEEDIRNKEGNLLFYGNFHGMQERDYEWAFLQMMNDNDFLYSSLIKDIYYLGMVLERKYLLIHRSLTVFLVGLIAAIIAFFGGNIVGHWILHVPHSH